MKTLSTPINTERQAAQSGWGEVYDFYLRSSITTPFGSMSVVRINDTGVNLSAFKPQEWPEPTATQGAAATYYAWPVQRKVVKATSKFANDRLAISVSNVTVEWAQMLADVDWEGVPVIIRTLAHSIASPTAADYVTAYVGRIDTARVTGSTLQFTCSSGMAVLQKMLPAENMHATCRYLWGDDGCTALRYLAANYKAKTAAAGGSTTVIVSAGFTEDAGAAPYVDEAVTADAGTDKITLTGHALRNGDRVWFGGTRLPGGLDSTVRYYVISAAANDFQVSLTLGGAAVNITSAGTAVTLSSTAPYGTDLIDALADGAITTSSEQTGSEGYQVKTSKAAASYWAFASNASNPSPSIDIYTPYFQIDFGSAQNVSRWVFTLDATIGADYSARRQFTIFGSADGSTWTQLQSTVSYTDVRVYYLTHSPVANYRYYRVQVRRESGDAFLDGILGKAYAYAAYSGGSDLINPLADGAFTASSEKTGYEAKYVQSGLTGVWKLNHTIVPSDFGVLDWGNNYQGYWQIPDAQAGLKNAALKPYLQFDLGSAKAPKLWRIKNRDGVERNDIPRLILFFSSTDGNTWVFERYFEVPPRAGEWFDIPIHAAATAQYWRICVRSIWSEQVNYSLFNKVEAFLNGRNWWKDGWVTFGAATSTVALRGVKRPVLASYSGRIQVGDLPTAPANGDTFVIERACPRDFNACAERLNTENFSGLTTLPDETVIR